MGCSSSSAQTVDQEKRPGTKPEESNGDSMGVRNGFIAEDAQTIEDQMQLPVQTALPDELQRGADDEAEAVLVALEAQEDLGSGEDLLGAAAEAAAPDEVATEAVATMVEPLLPAEEAAPVETVVAEVEALVEATEEAPAVEELAPVQPEASPEVASPEVTSPEVAPPEVASPVAGPVVSEPAEAPAVVEEAAAVEAEAPTDNDAPATVSTAPCESSEPREASAAPSEASAEAAPQQQQHQQLKLLH
ncbi:uncharacterized protein [Clinocottus analis]|uniref:uncharacterized protein n=1 Tax=Clinocottus analis TaxID=304258 RepID=UPI0035C16C34